MKTIQQTEVLGAIFPAAILDNASATAQVIDAKDAEYVEFHVVIGATDVDVSVLKVQESDTKTNATTLAGTPAVVDTATAVPTSTDDNSVFVFGVDCTKARKRYLQLVLTAGNGTSGTYASATAIVKRSGNRGSDATNRACAQVDYA